MNPEFDPVREEPGRFKLQWLLPFVCASNKPVPVMNNAPSPIGGNVFFCASDTTIEDGDAIAPERFHRYTYEFHERLSNALTCLMFALVGTGTGILLRRGTQLAALAVSVGYAVLYWVLALRLGRELIFKGVIPPWAGTWGPLLICALGGVWLVRRAFKR